MLFIVHVVFVGRMLIVQACQYMKRLTEFFEQKITVIVTCVEENSKPYQN